MLALYEARLDALHASAFRELLLNQLEQANRPLIVDMTSVHFIDSSGLGALFAANRKARQTGHALVLAGLQPRVRSMLELSRLDDLFAIYPSPEAALAASPEADGAAPTR